VECLANNDELSPHLKLRKFEKSVYCWLVGYSMLAAKTLLVAAIVTILLY